MKNRQKSGGIFENSKWTIVYTYVIIRILYNQKVNHKSLKSKEEIRYDNNIM